MKSITDLKKRVRVKWRDAISHAEWLSPQEAIKFKPAINTTEGFLLIKNKDVVICYMSYNDTDIGDTTVIPHENVVDICELKIPKKYGSKK
jgi:hypothetical protein|tara:strand:+ start:1419 stop:1691 length:273 start_codon:yes stop_codon:yes gene_type:complete